MNKTMCPGQDTRYWRPGDIFNVPCGSCGNDIEFFKDDVRRRCSRCGAVVQNPRLSMGCARWCGHAKECLGYDPSEIITEGDSFDPSIADAIIRSISRQFGPDSTVVEESLKANERASRLLKSSLANPRIVIPAALLLMVDSGFQENGTAGEDAASIPRNRHPVAKIILEEAGTDRNTVDDICGIIQSYHAGVSMDSPEYRIVAESRGHS